MVARFWPQGWRWLGLDRRLNYVPASRKSNASSRLAWAYALICVPLVLLAVEVVRGALSEIAMIRSQAVTSEMRALQSRAEQRTATIDILLKSHRADDQPWPTVLDEPWFRQFWLGLNNRGQHEIYAAIVNRSGDVVMHTDPKRIGQRLRHGWYEQRISDNLPEVVWAEHNPLAGGLSAYDVSIPLKSDGESRGDYHEGLDAAWLESLIETRQDAAARRWMGVLAIMLAVDGAAVGALVWLARWNKGVVQQLGSAEQRHVREVAQFGSGLAHEVRNPLHALRINLHTLRRALGGRSTLGEDQIVATIQDSDEAIDRLDALMRDLLQYSDRKSGQPVELDLRQEVQASLNLLQEDFRREQITVETELAEEPAPVVMNPTRLRQALMNVFTHAQNRVGKNGTIRLRLERRRGGLELTMHDSGPALSEEQRSLLFEPFQAPAETGTASGLAPVRVFVQEAGGHATWDGNSAASGQCRLWFPLAPLSHQGDRP
jgi:signal transduction histidine kinase